MPSTVFSAGGPVRRSWRNGLVALALATTAVVSVAASTAAGAEDRGLAPARSLTACATSALVIWAQSAGAATGHFLYNLEFTNESGHTCTLKGYPKVAAVNLAGGHLGSAATDDTSIPPALVTLGTNPASSTATATAHFNIANVAFFKPSACDPVWAAGLSITPPGQRAAKVVPLVFQVCAKKLSIMTVQAVQKS